MKCLVLSGGGEKGVSFLGAIKYLEEIDLISGVETFIGTSAGSIICSLIAIGYTYSEISYILSRINVPSLIPIDDMSIDNFFTNYGFLKHDKLRKVLSVLIDKKTKIQDISLKDVYDKYNKTLYITGSDIQNYECCYFSYKTHPEMKLVDAIIISCSIPLLFEPNIYQSEMYLDGAIFNNYPIKFAKELYSHKDVLGILVYFKRNKHSIKCLEDFLKNVIDCLLVRLQKDSVADENTVVITFDSDLYKLDNDKKIENMISQGYKSTVDYFKLLENKKTKLILDSIKYEDIEYNELFTHL